MNTVITNCLMNREGNLLEPCEIRIEAGIITALADQVSHQEAQIIDAKGFVVFPGFIDVHVHLREPGFEAKETIASGTKAAAMGGYTTICPMPNTNPVIDQVETLVKLQSIIEQDALVKVLPYATITHNLRSETLVDFAGLANQGAFAFTNDGVGVQTAGVMYQAMQQAKAQNKVLVAHTEDDSLLFGGVMNEGSVNHTIGLPGMLGLSESVQIARDVLLAQKTGAHYHVCHVSDAESVRVIREAKAANINVSAEVTPHHLLLCDQDITSDDANFKMNPPLRRLEDKQALITGLLDGTIDFIATDHAPHTQQEKAQGFLQAPFGIIGLESAFPLLYTHFVKTNLISLHQLIEWLSTKPAQVFHMKGGTLEVGEAADLVLIDLNQRFTIQEPFGSKSSNTPFMGWDVCGQVEMTWVDGRCVYQRGEHA